MRKYVVRRFLNMIPTLFLVSLIVFSLVRWLPSDPARLLAGVDESGAIDPVLYVKIKKELGLDQPLYHAVWLLAGRHRARELGQVLLERHGGLSTDLHRLHFTVQLALVAWLFGLSWVSPSARCRQCGATRHSIWP